MNGKQAKAIRKALGIKKPTPASESGIYENENGQLMFRRRSNPVMNTYRFFKKGYVSGRFRP